LPTNRSVPSVANVYFSRLNVN